MALDKLTKIDGGGISTTSDYRVGVITATKFVGPIEGSITATDASFSGNVSIAGTLTYEDVTNVDSVGILTARDDIKLTAAEGKIEATGATGLTLNASNGSAYVRIRTAGSERVRIEPSGDVGIGTDNPGARLHIFHTNPVLRLTDSNQAANNRHWNIAAGNTQCLRIQAINDAGSGGGSFFQFNRVDNGITEFIGKKGGNTWFTINNDNKKVGIGTTNPQDSAKVQNYTSTTRHQSFQSTNGDLAIVSDNNSNPVAYIKGTGSADLLNVFDNTTEVFTIKDGGKVGIGTADPSQILHISGTGQNTIRVDSSGQAISFHDHNEFYGYIGNQSGKLFINAGGTEDTLLLKTNGTERLRITSTGRVGIGNTTAATKLNVYNNSPSDVGGVLVQNANYANNQNKPYLIVGTQNWTGATTNWNTFGFQHKIKTDSNGVPRITIDTHAAEAFTLKNDGKVGINVSSPDEILHINGNFKVTGQIQQSTPADFWSQGNTFIELNGIGNITHMGGYETNITSNGYRDTNGQWVSYNTNSQSGAAQIALVPTGDLRFRTDTSKANGTVHNPTERVRISGGGQLTVGSNFTQTGHTLYVSSVTGGNAGKIVSTGGDTLTLESTTASSRTTVKFITNGRDWEIGARGSSGSPDNSFYFYDNNASQYRMVINPSGNVGINSRAPESKLDVFQTNGTIAIFGDPRSSSFECIKIKNNVSGYPAITNDSSTDTLDLRSFGSVQATIDSNNNSSSKYFRVMTNGQGGAGTELFRVQDNGRVGINYDSPAAPLDVKGADSGINIRSDSNDRPHLNMINGSTTMLRISCNGTQVDFGDGNSNSRYMTLDPESNYAIMRMNAQTYVKSPVARSGVYYHGAGFQYRDDSNADHPVLHVQATSNGGGVNNIVCPNSKIIINGKSIGGSGRSWKLTVIKGSGSNIGQVIHHQTYDVYGNGTSEATNYVNALSTYTTDNNVIIVTTSDEPEGSAGAIRTALRDTYGAKDSMYSYFRYAYVFAFRHGFGTLGEQNSIYWSALNTRSGGGSNNIRTIACINFTVCL